MFMLVLVVLTLKIQLCASQGFIHMPPLSLSLSLTHAADHVDKQSALATRLFESAVQRGGRYAYGKARIKLHCRNVWQPRATY